MNELPRRRTRRIPRFSKLRRAALERDEVNRIFDILNQRAAIIEQLQRDSEIQFKRIAQMQAEIDLLKKALRDDRRD